MKKIVFLASILLASITVGYADTPAPTLSQWTFVNHYGSQITVDPQEDVVPKDTILDSQGNPISYVMSISDAGTPIWVNQSRLMDFNSVTFEQYGGIPSKWVFGFDPNDHIRLWLSPDGLAVSWVHKTVYLCSGYYYFIHGNCE